ncbi:penicillin-binding transpeptidase domain-containing protein [Streptomyces sp. NBC_01443]|uniref:penicillin-binding transpeptidase domain-containing protein n=1 Tax=Streptomyces sp. NBC_01443 TaxID=2903868 RepID=UPI002256A091|nr:penicillin-binding transpeptidase domain-containing protein [Streptomyces sp. NBC_01443]MCX4627581.1 penicillin-binding transpeptidase domain-containing protein [Streptomyces sp. NBC_01443]WSW43692.1 penicillin-binding transpeptidase domain-containing protein [Streptomyces sp. NBC_01001]
MIRYIRWCAYFCALLLVALLVNVARVQVWEAAAYGANPANKRPAIERYAQPRGDVLVDGRPVTGSRDSGQLLRYERTYANGPLYAPVTGYSSQTYGTSLLERAEDAILSGTDPGLSAFPLWYDLARGRPAGGNAATTVRAGLQQAAYTGLAGRRGAVAALDPATGKILALVSSPSYDPAALSGTGAAVKAAWERLNADPARPMLNRALRETYPPGSTFKIVTAAAALDAGVVTDVDAPTQTPDPYPLPGTSTLLPNAGTGCRDASMAEAVQWSCNTVMAKIGVQVGLRGMVDAARRFGFDDDRLRVPAWVSRSNFDTDMSPDQLALSSIGQFNTTATPLQMAMVAAAVANGGELKSPYLVDRTTQDDGDQVRRGQQRSLGRAMNPATALRLQELMVQVVENGTGPGAAIPGAVVGGKTGTAQHGVGNAGTPYAWFIGWAKAEDAPLPGVAVAVVVEDAEAHRGDISGNGAAAPIARAVMEAALYGPPPPSAQ